MTSQLFTYGPRALKSALIILEQRCETEIVYEDSDYSNSAKVKLHGDGPIIPCSYELTFDFLSDVGKQQIDSLLTQANALEGHPQYIALEIDENASIKVVPSTQSSALITDIPVSLKCDQATFYEVACQLCETLLSSHGILLGIDRPPSRRFMEELVDMDFEMVGVGAVLSEIASKYKKDNDVISWKISRDPNGASAVAFHRVLRKKCDLNKVFIHIESDRPLKDAMNFIQSHVEKKIIYEDPYYECPCQVWVDASGRPQGLRGGVISTSYDKNASSLETLSKIVKSYEATVCAARYRIDETSDAMHLIPTETKNRLGEFVDYNSPLHSTIVAPLATHSLRQACQHIVDSLNKVSDRDYYLGKFPDAFGDFSIESNRLTANQYINSIVKKLDKTYRWQILFQPMSNNFELDIMKL